MHERPSHLQTAAHRALLLPRLLDGIDETLEVDAHSPAGEKAIAALLRLLERHPDALGLLDLLHRFVHRIQDIKQHPQIFRRERHALALHRGAEDLQRHAHWLVEEGGLHHFDNLR